MKKVMNGAICALAAILALSVVGCGKKKADVEATLETLEAIGKARAKPTDSKSALNSRVNHTQTRLMSAFPSHPSYPGMPGSGSDAGNQPSAPANSSPIDVLGEACTMTDNMSSSMSSGMMGPMEFKIGGDQCPIEFLMSMNFSETGFNAVTSMKAKSAEAKKMTDVDALEMKFSLTAGSDQKSAKIKMEMTGNSQKKGKLEMDLEGEAHGESQGNGSGEISGTLTMGDKQSDLKQVIKITNGKEESEYYINGEKLTEEQVKRAMGAMSQDKSEGQGSGHSVF